MKPRVVAVLAAAIVLLGGGLYVVAFTGVLGVRTVVVHGTKAVSEAVVRKTAAVPLGEPLARLDTGAISDRIGQIPGIAKVRVSRSWPSTVRIEVAERQPVAAVVRGQATWLVDVDGVFFQQVKAVPGNLPKLVVGHPETADPALRAGLGVIAALSARLRATVAVVEAPTPESVTLGLRDGRTVIWGGDTESDRKARVLEPLLTRPGKTYDVSTPSVAVVR